MKLNVGEILDFQNQKFYWNLTFVPKQSLWIEIYFYNLIFLSNKLLLDLDQAKKYEFWLNILKSIY